jgi:hypothetical protein
MAIVAGQPTIGEWIQTELHLTQPIRTYHEVVRHTQQAAMTRKSWDQATEGVRRN